MELFSPEIAELEDFIDSYVKEDTPNLELQREVQWNPIPLAHSFNNSMNQMLNDSSIHEEHFEPDFQQELLEYQRRQNAIQDAQQAQNYENWAMQQCRFNDISRLAPFSLVDYSQLQDGQNIPAEQFRPNEFSLGQNYHDIQIPDASFHGVHLPHMYYPEQLINGMGLSMIHTPNNSLVPEWVDTSKPPPPLPWAVEANFQNKASNSKSKPIIQQNGCKQPELDKTSDHLCNASLEKTPPHAIKMQRSRPPEVSELSWRVSPLQDGTRKNKFSEQNHNVKPLQRTSPSNGNEAWRRNPSVSEKDFQDPLSKHHKSPDSREPQKVPPKSSNRTTPPSRKSSQSSSSDGTGNQISKVVSGKSKAEVRSWLSNSRETKSKTNAIEKKMSELELSNDLPVFIKLAQSYITNASKLREVAEMLCNKAMRNPKFGEKSAVLCNEMSHHKALGTNFRSVVLKIVQGHFKNRHQLMMATIQNSKDVTWIGFVNLLVELYQNLRTSSDERLSALVNPIYDCFLLMLKETELTPTIAKCFHLCLVKVGNTLEKVAETKMSELIAELRDKCVLPTKTPVDTRRILLQSLEMYARGWSIPLDCEYYIQCSPGKLAK